MSKPWWQRAKARVRRLGVWKWRSPRKHGAAVKRLKARRGRCYVRPDFWVEPEDYAEARELLGVADD